MEARIRTAQATRVAARRGCGGGPCRVPAGGRRSGLLLPFGLLLAARLLLCCSQEQHTPRQPSTVGGARRDVIPDRVMPAPREACALFAWGLSVVAYRPLVRVLRWLV